VRAASEVRDSPAIYIVFDILANSENLTLFAFPAAPENSRTILLRILFLGHFRVILEPRIFGIVVRRDCPFCFTTICLRI
jgi:hypothetical protein